MKFNQKPNMKRTKGKGKMEINAKNSYYTKSFQYVRNKSLSLPSSAVDYLTIIWKFMKDDELLEARK